jgi:hypothetical protein
MANPPAADSIALTHSPIGFGLVANEIWVECSRLFGAISTSKRGFVPMASGISQMFHPRVCFNQITNTAI